MQSENGKTEKEFASESAKSVDYSKFYKTKKKDSNVKETTLNGQKIKVKILSEKVFVSNKTKTWKSSPQKVSAEKAGPAHVPNVIQPPEKARSNSAIKIFNPRSRYSQEKKSQAISVISHEVTMKKLLGKHGIKITKIVQRQNGNFAITHYSAILNAFSYKLRLECFCKQNNMRIVDFRASGEDLRAEIKVGILPEFEESEKDVVVENVEKIDIFEN